MQRTLFLAAFLASLLFVTYRQSSTAEAAGPVLNLPSTNCDGATASVTFSWQPVSGQAQFVDLSLLDNGFQTGTFVGTGPLATSISTYTWSGLTKATPHFWRVNTLTAGGWEVSEAGAFVPCGGPALRYGPITCSGANAMVHFRWAPPSPAATTQWLDLSLNDNGFAQGTFVGASFEGNVDRMEWSSLEGGKTYYFRVNSLTSSGWISTFTASFTPTCSAATAPSVSLPGLPVAPSLSSTAPQSSGPSATISDGIHRVGIDILPGTYRTLNPSKSCYWERVSGLGGGFGELLANDNEPGPAIVTILPGDVGFESSRCGTWSQNLSAITSSQTGVFGDGKYLVGIDIAPGTWRASNPGGCYWARMRTFEGELSDIISNDYGGGLVTIASSDHGFSSSGCGTWTKIG